MLRDVELFKNTLGGLDGFGDAGEHLTNIVKGKEIAPEASEAVSTEPAKDTTQEDKGKQDKADGKDEEKTDKACDKDASTKDEKTESSEEEPPEPPAKDDADTSSKKDSKKDSKKKAK